MASWLLGLIPRTCDQSYSPKGIQKTSEGEEKMGEKKIMKDRREKGALICGDMIGYRI